MVKKFLRRAVFAALALTAVVTSTGAVPAASASGRGLLPALPLQAGDPVFFCLTDASAKALREADIELEALAPATVVTEGGHQCMRAVLAAGQINTDLTGLTGWAEGGFAFRRGSQRAEFAEPRCDLALDRTGTFSAVHQGKRIDVMTSTAANVNLSLSKVSTQDLPMRLTEAGANALAATFTTSPVPAGEQLFAGSASFKVLPPLGVPGLL